MTITGASSTILWEPKYFANLFEFDWEHSQLLLVINELGIKDLECSISGGTLVRTAMKTDIFKGDIDIFPHSKKGLEDLIAKFKGERSWRKNKHAWEFDFSMGVRKTKVQVITRDTTPKNLEETLQSFDFEHCKIGYFPLQNTIMTGMGAPVMLSQKKLRLGYVREPQYSLGRAIKYKKMGFDADDAMEQLVAMQIKGLKEHNFDNFAPADVWKEIVKAASSS